MTELQEVNFSDLLQRPNQTVDKLKSSRSRALRVHRRGNEDDLILTTVAQAAQDSALVEVTIRLLRAVTNHPVLRSQYLLDILPQVFPWLRFLPDDDRTKFAQELVDVMEAGKELGTPAPALQLIAEWRHTAEVYADPELLAALRSQTLDDFGVVTAPATDS
jgi:hypothetical protein